MDLNNVSGDSTVRDIGNDSHHVPTANRRLVDGISFSDFLKNKETFFEIARDEYTVPEIDNEEDEKEMQKRVIESQIAWESDLASTGGVKPMNYEEGEHLKAFSELEVTMTDVLHDIDGSELSHQGGVKKRIINRGYGEEAKRGDLVWVHYKLHLEDRDEPFDATLIQNGPKRFTVGNGEVIRGLDIALMGMSEGEEDICIVRHEYAFGPLGCPPRIPKEAKILMYVRLIRVHASDTEIAVEDLSYEERKDKGFNVIYDAAKRRKTIGNDFLAKGEADDAVKEYSRAQELATELIPTSDVEIDKTNVLMYSIQLNLAKVYIDTEKFRRAIKHCKEALATPLIEPRKVKAYYRLARALFESGKVEESLSYIETANNLGFDPSVKQLYNKITNEIAKRKIVERETAKKMFQNLQINNGFD